MWVVSYLPDGEAYQDLLQTIDSDVVIVPWKKAEADPEVLQKAEVVLGWAVPQEVIDALPRLRWIQGAGAGVDWLGRITLPEEVQVTRIVDQFGPDMAEYALLMALAWVKDLRRIEASRGTWDHFLVGRLADKRVGVLGAGSIGGYIAKTFGPLVKEVRALGRTSPDMAGVTGFSQEDWAGFFDGLDLLVMVLPSTPETYHVVDRQSLSRMATGGFVINVGRGAVLDTEALRDLIGQGQLSGAALDVFETEPLASDDPLWSMPEVYVSSHISGPSRPEGVLEMFAENLRRYREGLPFIGLVDRRRGY